MKAAFSATLPSAVLLAALFVYGCGTSDPILDPSFTSLNRAAPDSFDVEMTTSAGPIRLRINRAWAPIGVDRAFYLFNNNFYEGARFYRVIPGFVAQFGGSGEVMVDSLWRELAINDEPVRAGNARGTVAFARAGPRSRSFTMYINLSDNFRLDTLNAGGVRGYPPIGRVVDGMSVVDSLYGGYGARPMGTDLGARTLRQEYPRLDSIAATRIARMY